MMVDQLAQFFGFVRTRVVGVLGVVVGVLLAATTLSSAPVSAASDDLLCVAGLKTDMLEARARLQPDCGIVFDDQLAHMCTYVANPYGWVCHEFPEGGRQQVLRSMLSASNSTPPASTFTELTPTLREPLYNGTYVSLVWTLLPNIKSVNIYRNGEYLTSSSYGNVWNDYSGEKGDKYYIYAYSKNSEYSKKSSELVTVDGGVISGVRNLQAKKLSANKIELTWKGTSSAVQYWEIYRGDRLTNHVMADPGNPGRTFTFHDTTATKENHAGSYKVRAVNYRGQIAGDPAAVLSPYAKELFDRATRNATGTRGLGIFSFEPVIAPAPALVGGGKTTKSKTLASYLNEANRNAHEAQQDAYAAAVDFAVDGAEAFRAARPNPNRAAAEKIRKAGDAYVALVVSKREAERLANEAAAMKKTYDSCRGSSTCWNGPKKSDGGDGDPSPSTDEKEKDNDDLDDIYQCSGSDGCP